MSVVKEREPYKREKLPTHIKYKLSLQHAFTVSYRQTEKIKVQYIRLMAGKQTYCMYFFNASTKTSFFKLLEQPWKEDFCKLVQNPNIPA